MLLLILLILIQLIKIHTDFHFTHLFYLTPYNLLSFLLPFLRINTFTWIKSSLFIMAAPWIFAFENRLKQSDIAWTAKSPTTNIPRSFNLMQLTTASPYIHVQWITLKRKIKSTVQWCFIPTRESLALSLPKSSSLISRMFICLPATEHPPLPQSVLPMSIATPLTTTATKR